MIAEYLHSLLQRLIMYEQSPKRLALTCAVGIYIGISPFVGFHTAMVFLFGWLFSLRIPALLAISIAINNPWTMVPVYSFDYIFGTWLFELCNISYAQLEPEWIDTCNIFLKEKIGINSLSLSAFLVGGNALGIGIALFLYPLLKRFFTLYCARKLSIQNTIN